MLGQAPLFSFHFPLDLIWSPIEFLGYCFSLLHLSFSSFGPSRALPASPIFSSVFSPCGFQQHFWKLFQHFFQCLTVLTLRAQNLIGGILMLIAVVLYWPTAILAADSPLDGDKAPTRNDVSPSLEPLELARRGFGARSVRGVTRGDAYACARCCFSYLRREQGGGSVWPRAGIVLVSSSNGHFGERSAALSSPNRCSTRTAEFHSMSKAVRLHFEPRGMTPLS